MADWKSSRLPASRLSPDADLAQRFVIGFAGGVLASLVMNLFSRAVTAARDGREAPGAAPGEDRAGRGVQPAQAEHVAEDDATIRVGTVAYRAVTGQEPSGASRPWLGTAAHLAFGGTVGACYAVLAQRMPMIRAGRGTAYGTAVWMVADEMVMPLLRQRGSRARMTADTSHITGSVAPVT